MTMEYIKGFENKQYGLLGEHLSHSFSPQIHREMADYPYELYEVERESLGDWVKENSLSGYNVTIPYKQEIMQYLDELSPAAESIGAVNTVVRKPDGRLVGDNTDYYGFKYMLSCLKVDFLGKKAIILGNGGASKTVQAVLKEQGAEVIVFDVGLENNYSNISHHSDATLVVNATPVGMYPNTGQSLVDLSIFTECKGVADLIYNPARTALLLQAESMNIPTVNGLSMLVAQAKRAAELFTDTELDDAVIEKIRKKVASETENLILVGMPGSGKTTVGRILSEKMNRKFVDGDEEITLSSGRKPSEIINSDGERAFRIVETETLKGMCKQSSSVIATGGGVVTIHDNLDILRQNGRIIFIERDVAVLPKDDRPLSVNLTELYEKRLPLYNKFSDRTVDGNASAEVVAERVLKAFEEEFK